MRIEKKKKNMTMMKKRHILHWAMGVVMTPLLGSCAFDELYEIAGGGDGMSFSVEVTQLQEELGSSFRAPRITDTEISGDNMKMYVRRTTEGYVHRHEAKGVATRGISVSSIDKFTLNSYTYSTSLSSATPVSTNEEITRSGGWKSSMQWQKASDNMAFYAYYAGTSSSDASFLLDASGNPTLSYTVADAVTDQQDLLVAKKEDVTGDGTNKNIDLTFSHALTAVQFGIGSTMAAGTITKIELQGIKNSGTYNFSSDAWSSQSGSQTYTLDNLNIDISGNKGTTSATKLITGQSGSDNLLLLMPQTLGTDAKLVVTIESNERSHVLTMNLSGTWSPGHTVTYSLSTTKETGDYVLKVSDPSLSTNEEGGSVSTTVTSYHQDYYGTQTPVAWTATYDFASDTDKRTPKEKAISSQTTSGSGGTLGETLSATIAKQYPKSDKTWTASEQGTENEPFDLSKYDPSSSTHELTTAKSANCYVVNAPGWYKIPLYYGNSLNNGNGYGTETFQNHAGTQISSSNCDFSSSVSSGKLLWQDEYALITPTSISKTSDGQYLKFYVSPDAIAQGNAVIAALNSSDEILWSWHIWVTNEDLTQRVNIKSGSTRQTDYHFMTKPVGYCEASTLSYPERVINIKITQKNASGISGAIVNTDKTTSLAITQSSTKTISVAQNCTFYQWGRKDPFPGASSNDNTVSVQKLCYKADGSDFVYDKKGSNITSGDGKQSMAGSILNPTTFYFSKTTDSWDSQDNDWCSTTYNDNWSKISKTIVSEGAWNDDNIIKTVYDPCPIGFKMPGCNAFTRFTKDGNYHYSNDGHTTCNGDAWKNRICVSNENSYETNKGWSFYTQADDTGETDFWYAFGFIDCYAGRYSSTGKGCLAYAGVSGYYWSARAYSAGLGCYLSFDSGGVYPRSTNLRAFGFAARPVSE